MSNLFDKDFFPTPDRVILKMVAPYADNISSRTILEPSAGGGAILDFLTKTGIPQEYELGGMTHTLCRKADAKKVYAIEKNPDLQMILHGKKYPVIGDDFLSCIPDVQFDLIVMNPPFQTGDQHLLHAWNILHHGDIACLLNAETIRNPYSATRKQLVRIIAENGSTEELGRCFADADRKTDVEVVLVRLHKQAKEQQFVFNPGGGSEEEMPDFGSFFAAGGDVEKSSRLDAYIRTWDKAKNAAVEYIKARQKLRFFLAPLIDHRTASISSGVSPILEIDKALGESSALPETDAYNAFIRSAKQEAWRSIFNQMDLQKYMTSGLEEKLTQFRNSQSAMEITKENVVSLFRYIMDNIVTIMDSAVVDVYDMFTRFYSGNTSYKEGWKTNKRFSCNKKIILPGLVECGFLPQRYGYSKKFSVSWTYRQRLEDIDKAMCWLSGRSFESLSGEMDVPGQGKCYSPKDSTLVQALERIDVGDQSWHESAFFRVKAFKKGTVHIEFIDEDLLAKFCIKVNDGKGLIGMAEAV